MEEKLKEIEDLIEKEDYTRAAKLSDEVLAEDENCAMAYCLKADAYFFGLLADDENSIIQLATKAIELDPNIARAYYIRGIARSWSYGNLRNPRLEIEDYDKALELNPNY